MVEMPVVLKILELCAAQQEQSSSEILINSVCHQTYVHVM